MKIQNQNGTTVTGTTIGASQALDVNVVQQTAVAGTQTSTLVDAVDAAITATLNSGKLGLDVNVLNQSIGSGDKEIIGAATSGSVVTIGGIDDNNLVAKIKARANGRLTVEQLSYVFNIIKGGVANHHWHENAVEVFFGAQDVDILMVEGAWLETAIAGQWSVASDSFDDTNAAGLGAQQVTFEYYTQAGVHSTESVSLAGFTPVNMVALDAFRLQSCVVTMAGDLRINQGTISIYDAPNGTGNIIAQILPFNSHVRKLIFYTGANEEMFIVKADIATDNKNIFCFVELHENKSGDMAGTFVEHKKRFFASGKGEGGISPDFPLVVPQLSKVEIYGQATNAGDTGRAGLGGWSE